MKTALVTWLLAAMSAWAPLAAKPPAETHEAAEARRLSIAEDLYAVAFSSIERPLFSGPDGRAMTALFIEAWIKEESGGYHPLVDWGFWRGDSKTNKMTDGTSWCLTQQNIGSGRTAPWNYKEYRFALPGDPPEEVTQGWTGLELVKDRKKCFAVSLHVFHESVKKCGGGAPLDVSKPINPDVFSVYAAGVCVKGLGTVQTRFDRFWKFWTERHSEYQPVTEK